MDFDTLGEKTAIANFYWCKLNNDHECGWWVIFMVTSACPSNASQSCKAWSRSRKDRASGIRIRSLGHGIFLLFLKLGSSD